VEKVSGFEKSIGKHTILRHRKLPKGGGVAGSSGCKSLGESCGTVTLDGETITYGDCCSGTDGRLICPFNECCLSDGASGCDTPDDSRCCSNLCNVTESKCININTTEIRDDEDNLEERQCGMKGNTCNITDDGDNTCCGDVKYGCNNTIIDVNTSQLCYSDFYCCMPDGGKGCGNNCHCCSGNCTESTCVGADANGGRVCPLKGDFCNTTAQDCCGDIDIRMDCQELSAGSEDGICCILSAVQGCEHDEDCCSGYCDTDASTCCIPLNKNCTNALPDECCSGGCVDNTCCIKNGDSSTSDSDCCSGHSDSTKCCLDSGSPCGETADPPVDPADCCGNCLGGECVV